MDIEQFKSILKDEKIASVNIVQRYLVYGDPYVFNLNLNSYYSLKEATAKQFEVHPHNIIMVGSAKLGFSIAPTKKWKPFDQESDIDIVIVSEKLFTKFWSELFLFNDNISRDTREADNFVKFKDYFFRGWIRPDLFNFNYKGKTEWFDFFKSLSQNYGQGHKITGALYCSFDFFELYHIKNIEELRKMELQQ